MAVSKLKDMYVFRLAILLVIICLYFTIPGLQSFVKQGFGYLKAKDFENLRLFILSYGVWAPISSIALMSFQSIVPLVPGLMVTITNAWIFGWQEGAFYSWCGALIGAVLDFIIARWYGRPLVESLINVRYLNMADNFFSMHGVVAVFITRIVPIVPFKVISYSAGLTAIKLRSYVIATAIGQTPGIILYSILGQNIRRSFRAIIVVTLLLALVAVILYVYRGKIENYIYKRK